MPLPAANECVFISFNTVVAQFMFVRLFFSGGEERFTNHYSRNIYYGAAGHAKICLGASLLI